MAAMTPQVPGYGQEMETALEPGGEARQLKSAMDGFVSEIKSFRAEIKSNLNNMTSVSPCWTVNFRSSPNARRCRPAMAAKTCI
jgi:hypothetical protein